MRPDHPNGSVQFYEVVMGDERSLISGLNCTLKTCDDSRQQDFKVIAVNAFPSNNMDFDNAFPDNLFENKLCEEDNSDSIRMEFLNDFGFYRSVPLTNQLQCSSGIPKMILFAILFACIFVPALVLLSFYKIRKMQDIKVVLPPGLGFSSSPVKNNIANISPDEDHDVDSEQTMETTDNECSTLTGKEYNYRTQDFEKVISDKPQLYLTNSNAPVIENFTTNKDVSGYIKIQPDTGGYIKIQPNAGGYVTFPLTEPTKVSFKNIFLECSKEK